MEKPQALRSLLQSRIGQYNRCIQTFDGPTEPRFLRMATLQPQTFGSKYVQWADDIRITLGGNDADGNPHVTSNGTVTPSVNPLDWTDTTPYTAGSPEGQNFVVLMYAAWRDCILASICSESGGVSKRGSIAKFRI